MRKPYKPFAKGEFRKEYESLMARRPLRPRDIKRLETLMILMRAQVKNGR